MLHRASISPASTTTQTIAPEDVDGADDFEVAVDTIPASARADATRTDHIVAVQKVLPRALEAIKQQVIDIAKANTTRTDNVKEVRAQLDPLVAQLGKYFAANRPANELTQTQGVWKNLWYDNPDIDRGPFFLKLDRASVRQVVEDGYYYNVANSAVKILGLKLGTVHSFLRGNYTVGRPATPETQGEERRNVIQLEFADLRVKFGGIKDNVSIQKQVDRIVTKTTWSLPSPGPRGVKGELWNVYVDDTVRIAAGFQADKPEELQLYVLQRE